MLPWQTLIDWLRDGDGPALPAKALTARGIDAGALLEAGIVQRQDPGHWRPRDCAGHCDLTFDFATRRAEGLVGMGCPRDPPCWEGWRWVTRETLDVYRLDIPGLLAALARHNGLAPLAANLPTRFKPLGRYAWRDQSWPVLWVSHWREDDALLVPGLRGKLGADALILLTARGAERSGLDWTLLPLPAAGADLALWHALDRLAPTWRETVTRDKLADFEDIKLAFAAIPGQRHILRLNGRKVAGFADSNLKFLRLLTLAVHRLADHGPGWIKKIDLGGDDQDHDLEALRKALAQADCDEWESSDLRRLIKASGDGRIRLAVRPTAIRFDSSLSGLQLLKPPPAKKTQTPNQELHRRNVEHGLQLAEGLLARIRKTGLLP